MSPLPPQPQTLGAPRTPTARFGTIVVHDLVTAIVVGDFNAGELLPSETELCDHFGVSRTVIRESIKRLEEKGMVSVAQGRGTVVTQQHDWNILDRVVLTVMIENDAELGILDEIATVRAELESGMADRAAGRRDDADIAELLAAHARLEETIEDSEAFAASDVDFHPQVMAIAGDRLAQGIARTLTSR
ncbi:MAG: FadR family transcriptional regulator, partial [Leucobacter sp.]|nr:FadR family transcriptional regulator [Leucobacter sp.]